MHDAHERQNNKQERTMRVMITATAVVAVSLVALGQSTAQTRSQPNKYNQCVELASRLGFNVKSAQGRKFMNGCMRRRADGSFPNCPSRDNPLGRSSYPSWMCP
jgi:hypothetical protein